MTAHYVISDISANVVPWIHIDTANNKIYVLGLAKIDDEIEQKVYENYNLGITQDFFSDYDANIFLNIDNLKTKAFPNTYNSGFDFLFLKGSQLQTSAGNSLFFISHSLIYTFNPNNGISEDNTRELQFERIRIGRPAALTLPEKFVFDKDKQTLIQTSDFNESVLLQVVAGLGVNSLSDALILLHSHPTFGYYSNLPLANTSNTYSTFVNYLPSIAISNTAENFLATVYRANGQIFTQANTKLYITNTKGYVAEKEVVVVNATANLTVADLYLAANQTIVVRAGWSNYQNVVEYTLSTSNSEIPIISEYQLGNSTVNSVLNVSSLHLQNSTANSLLDIAKLKITNSTATTNVTADGLKVGSVTVNTAGFHGPATGLTSIPAVTDVRLGSVAETQAGSGNDPFADSDWTADASAGNVMVGLRWDAIPQGCCSVFHNLYIRYKPLQKQIAGGSFVTVDG